MDACPMNSYDDQTADRIADLCEQDHDRRHDECEHCDYRATIQKCGQCGARFEDGAWYAETYLRALTSVCKHESLVDDWGDELTCGTMESAPVYHRCGDPVTTPGRRQCDFHAREADAVEAVRIYQGSLRVVR
jgi:hypothetical protein